MPHREVSSPKESLNEQGNTVPACYFVRCMYAVGGPG